MPMIRMRVGAKDRRKLHMKGYVEIEPFQIGDYEGSFVVFARDVVSLFCGLSVSGCGVLMEVCVGEPAGVARDVEGARPAFAYQPACVQEVAVGYLRLS